MKCLIVYHSGASFNARKIFEAFTHHPSVELTVIVPQKVAVPTGKYTKRFLVAKKEKQEYELLTVPLRDPYNYRRGFEINLLFNAMRKIRPDIIHIFDELTSRYLFQVTWLSRLIWPSPKVLFYGFENMPFRLSRRAKLKWNLTWLKLAGGAVANSEALNNIRKAGFPQNRPLERIFWGIPTDVFKPMDKQKLRAKFNLDCDYIVGFVGQLIPEKGVRVFLAALCHLPKNVHGLIVGDGPLRAELELLAMSAKLKDRVHFVGVAPQFDVPKYINCMDVIAVPSLTMPCWKEQYGRVIAEALACGIPVVASDSGAIPEVAGHAALVVKEGDSVALASTLHSVLFSDSIRESLSQVGLERARAELSTDVFVKNLLRLYQRVMSR